MESKFSSLSLLHMVCFALFFFYGTGFATRKETVQIDLRNQQSVFDYYSYSVKDVLDRVCPDCIRFMLNPQTSNFDSGSIMAKTLAQNPVMRRQVPMDLEQATEWCTLFVRANYWPDATQLADILINQLWFWQKRPMIYEQIRRAANRVWERIDDYNCGSDYAPKPNEPDPEDSGGSAGQGSTETTQAPAKKGSSTAAGGKMEGSSPSAEQKCRNVLFKFGDAQRTARVCDWTSSSPSRTKALDGRIVLPDSRSWPLAGISKTGDGGGGGGRGGDGRRRISESNLKKGANAIVPGPVAAGTAKKLPARPSIEGTADSTQTFSGRTSRFSPNGNGIGSPSINGWNQLGRLVPNSGTVLELLGGVGRAGAALGAANQ